MVQTVGDNKVIVLLKLSVQTTRLESFGER